MQRQNMLSNQVGFNWKFVAYVAAGEDETTSAVESAKNYISGKMYSDQNLVPLQLSLLIASTSSVLHFFHFVCNLAQDWWDNSSQAGPKSRQKVDHSEPQPTMQILVASGDKLQWLAIA